ncbi:MAG: DUF2239 family protein [Xanthobacteraceae bacterium]|nr:DUF2239 family protein [Xanthobacteraceae bacterium]
MARQPAIIAFDDDRCIASGDMVDVATRVKQTLSAQPHARILIFDIDTSHPVEIDFRGSIADVTARLRESLTQDSARAAEPTPRGPGRPKLGVVAREITLLPRHWDWLAAQSGGASVTLRKMIDDARRTTSVQDYQRGLQEAVHRFMSAMAGDKPRYEDALRALYANDGVRFHALIADWPCDVRRHVERLTSDLFRVTQDTKRA